MAGIETNPGAAEKFRFRYQYLLVEIGTKMLRHVFDYKIDRDFDKYLTSQKYEKVTLQKLISAKQITVEQSQYLPPIDMKPDSSKFDISLLICLLRHVCNLKHPNDPVWYNPSSTDTSLEANIARLSICRNWAWLQLPHSGTVFIFEAEFSAKWNELSQILNRLNDFGGTPKIPNLSSFINDAEKMDIDEKLEKSHQEAIETWLKSDNYYHAFIFRYKYLLIKLGTDVLRKVFDVVVGNNVAQYLTAKSQEIQRLMQVGVITAYQKLLLSPIGKKPDSSKFDITLLSCLLRSICGLRQPKDPVWREPAITDTSVEADITRLRMCKNKLMFSDKLVLPEADRNFKWQDLCVILLRLNNVGGTAQLKSDISNAATMVIDKQLMVELNTEIQAWHESDKLIDKGIDEVLIGKMFQLRLELNELGTAVLQKHFDYRVGNDFAKYLTSHEAEKTTLQWLIDTNIISKLQVKSLHEFLQTTSLSYVQESQLTFLPMSDQTPSSSYMYADNSDQRFPSLKSPKLDISLLSVLLRYVCGLRAPNDLVWKVPSHKDMSTEADIGRLWQCRNRITLKHLDEEKADKLLNELREILKRLGRGVGIEDDLFSSTGDAQIDDYLDDIHIDILDTWYARDEFRIAHFYRSFQTVDDDAWTIDEKNVSFLLSGRTLPNAKQLKQICERFGSSSPTVRKT